MTPDQLQNFNSGDFVSAQAAWGTAAGQAASAQSGITSAAGSISDWQGPAASAAHGHLTSVASVAQPAATALQEAQPVVQAFIAGVLKAQADLKTAVAQANAIPGHVDMSTGVVTPDPAPFNAPPAGASASDVSNAHSQQAQANADRAAAAKAAQAAVQAAVKEATDADQRGAGDLHDGNAAAHDVSRLTVATSSDYMWTKNLLAGDLFNLGDGQRWFGQEVSTAQQLANQTSNGNAQAASQLGPYSYVFANDHTFATALATAIGAPGMIDLENTLGLKIAQGSDNASGSVPKNLQDSQSALNSFLAGALGSATAGLTSDSDPGSASHLSAQWVSQLNAAAQQQTSYTSFTSAYAPSQTSKVSGYYGLSQILSAANTQNPYSTPFLQMVQPGLFTYDKAHIGQPTGFSVTNVGGTRHEPIQDSGSSYTDPVAGFLNAAATNSSYSNSFLSGSSLAPSPYGAGGADGNLHYLIHTHQWTMPGSDGAASLGNAIISGSQQPGAAGANLGYAFVNQYGNELGSHQAGNNGDNLVGLRLAAGQVISQHIGDLQTSIGQLRTGSLNPSGPLGPISNGSLLPVLQQAGENPVAYQLLLNAQNQVLAQQTAAHQNTQQASEALGYIVGAHDVGTETASKETDFARNKEAAEENAGAQALIGLGIRGVATNPAVGAFLAPVLTAIDGVAPKPSSYLTDLHSSAEQAAANDRAAKTETSTTGPNGQPEPVNVIGDSVGDGITGASDDLGSNAVFTYAPNNGGNFAG